MTPPDLRVTLLRVIKTLEALGLTYCIGGSLASSRYGLPRATNDADLVVGLLPAHAAPLVAALEQDFMIEAQSVSTAIAGRRSFNIIDYATLDKVDIFVMADQPWSHQQLSRRRELPLSDEKEAPIVFFASPEDVVLSKLVWYRRGGEISDRQWLDILSVLSMRASSLDWPYLRYWASDLGVSDLLTRAATRVDPDDARE